MFASKKIVTAAAMLVAAAGAAHAADLPARVAPAPYVAPVPVFTWSGAYFGINAGAAFDNKEKFTTANNATILGGGTSFSDSGFSAGGFGGFGGPGSGLVLGFEADAMYMDTDKSVNLTNAGNTASYRSGLDFLGTARGRLGWAMNQFMIYGTGGFAYGDVNSRVVSVGGGSTAIGSSSGFNTGYTYGGGVEYALPTGSFLNFFHSSAVTLKAEYLRYELDSSNLKDTGAGTVNLPAGIKVKNDGNIARIGLNYKF
jgi:outer membrane immunogenic protein